MKASRILCFSFWAILFVLLFPSGASAAEASGKNRTVVVISIDGFPSWIWDDDRLPTPTLRKLAREGALARRMTVSNPSVTWPNHTTLVTGVPASKHGVLFNGLLIRQGPTTPPKIEPWRDKNELIRVPTVYDLAYKAGLTTAHVDWIPTTNSGTFTWEFPEIPNPKGPVEQEMVAKGLITGPELATFMRSNPAWRDLMWTRAAVHLIEEHHPNLLLFHLLNTDASNHRFAAGSWASHTAFAYADRCVADVLEALERAGRKDQATVFIVTDHGFKTAQRIIRPNRALRGAGLLRAAGASIASCDAYALAQGGIAKVFVTDPAKRSQLIPRLREIFQSVEGVERILEARDYPGLGLPTPEENDQMADLVLVAKTGYGFQASHHEGEVVTGILPDTYPGHHGYLNTDPQLDGVFIAWGWGIRRGVELERIRNLDVAPTVAALLGLTMPDVDGAVLREILEPAR